ncbi:MAG: hypothetical protein HY236_07735 [Acidobacteria bacterium]|nr:hypothetical protein [Acidobacteriota bacterium]
MGLEDLAMMCAEPTFTVLYPSDAVSAWRATEAAAGISGPVYLRIGRPKAPVLYKLEEKFEVGRCKVLRRSDRDRVTIVAGGVTVFEALKACDRLAPEGIAVRVIDLYSVQPIDREGLREAAQATGGKVMSEACCGRITAEPQRAPRLTFHPQLQLVVGILSDLGFEGGIAQQPGLCAQGPGRLQGKRCPVNVGAVGVRVMLVG